MPKRKPDLAKPTKPYPNLPPNVRRMLMRRDAEIERLLRRVEEVGFDLGQSKWACELKAAGIEELRCRCDFKTKENVELHNELRRKKCDVDELSRDRDRLAAELAAMKEKQLHADTLAVAREAAPDSAPAAEVVLAYDAPATVVVRGDVVPQWPIAASHLPSVSASTLAAWMEQARVILFGQNQNDGDPLFVSIWADEPPSHPAPLVSLPLWRCTPVWLWLRRRAHKRPYEIATSDATDPAKLLGDAMVEVIARTASRVLIVEDYSYLVEWNGTPGCMWHPLSRAHTGPITIGGGE